MLTINVHYQLRLKLPGARGREMHPLLEKKPTSCLREIKATKILSGGIETDPQTK